MIWRISEPAENTFVTAEDDGVRLKSSHIRLDKSENLSNIKPKTRLGRLLPTLIPQMLGLEMASVEDGSISIDYADFVRLEELGIDGFETLVPWSPFLMEIESFGTLGRHDFGYKLRYFWGRQQAHLERMGCFVKRGQSLFRLDRQSYALIEAITNFNELPGIEKESSDSLISFASIKGLSESVGAEIDGYIYKNRVVIPPSIGLDILVEEGDRITFAPKIDIDGISPESIRTAFIASEDPSDICIETSDGGRVRVVFNDEQKEALRRMQKVRHISGHERANVLRNPQAVFDGIAGAVDIQDFGPRVRAIGDFPFVSQPFVQSGNTGIFCDPDIDTPGFDRKKLNVGIKCHYADGREEDVLFESRPDLLDFCTKAKVALQQGTGTVDLKGKTILIDRDFVKGIESVIERVTRKKKDRNETGQSQRKYLLIYENEEELEYIEDKELSALKDADLTLPIALREEFSLKDHQRKGVRWLQTNYLLNRSGCLLADDMGLGKTLQVLTFLAWLIERGDISQEGADKDKAPWNPILIVAPVMLLENEIWINDMKTFFKDDGAIFTPYITLHGERLKTFRKGGMAGRETELETSVLDLDKLRSYRVILTNYETIVNYQFSFAMMKSSWSVIVTDEAQEHKTPKTKISHALKSLSPKFRIACTGTPVETQLIDVWNIFDFLQPGSLLGTAKEFADSYAKPLADNPNNNKIVLDSLRERLHFGKASAYLLRRDKTKELDGLPKKQEHKILCDLSSLQRERHIDFVSRGRAGGDGNHPLGLLQQLMRLYQHPSLIPHYEPFDAERLNEAFTTCPKLQRLIEILKDIRQKKEKVLIFTRSLDMQQLLATAISGTFGICPDIVNGATSRSGSTKTSTNTRKEIIRRFRESDGFNVIILSPDVAGVGLTLVEANHVVHYGRWWNPAKESQATDRVYRIGQKKEVNVYYLIARDPQNVFKTFDEKLNALIEKRRKVADDFLAPMPSEEDMGKEIYNDIFEDTVQSGPVHKITTEDVRRLTWDRFEALVAILEEKQGRKVILTPRSGDCGIDVISISGNQIKLIQCKHTQWDSSVETDIIAETINAFDNYRGGVLRGYCSGFTMTPVLVTNGTCTRSTRQTAASNDVQIISDQAFGRLLDQYPCTLAEIEMIEVSRLKSMSEVKARFRNIKI